MTPKINRLDPLTFRKFNCNIFYYLIFYTKVCFYLFILPFYVHIEEGRVKFKRYLLHQIPCFILHLISLHHGLTSFWPIGSVSLYQFAMYAVVNTGILVFMINCWCVKLNSYKNLLQHSFELVDTNATSLSKYLKLSIVIIVCVHLTITIYPDVSKVFGSSGFTKCEFYRGFLVAITTYFSILFQAAVSIQYLLSAVSMFCIGKQFHTMANVEYAILASPTLKWQSRSLDRLMDYYLSAKYLTKQLNKAFGKIVILDFISILPPVGLGLAYIFPTAEVDPRFQLADHIRTIYTLISRYILAMMAANGSSNVQQFTEVAFEQLWKSRCLEKHEARKLSLIMQYVKSSCVGIGGDPFFVITYKIIGSMTSTVITYTVLMLQMR